MFAFIWSSFSEHITSSKNNANYIFLLFRVLALIGENYNDTDVVIYTDESAVRHHRGYWASIALSGGRTVQEVIGYFPLRLAA